MKLKYYLRGLGFGIFFTALICGTGRSTAKEPMSDSEIIQRAKELGMVEGTLADGKAETSEMAETKELEKVIETALETETETETVEILVEESKTQEKTETTAVAEESKNLKESTAVKESKETKESAAIKESKETKESAAIKESSEKKEDTSVATVTFTIPSGCGSYEVAKLLEENKLIKNAVEYDTFLCANDYDRRISSGTYQIPVGADEETIAKIITKTEQ